MANHSNHTPLAPSADHSAMSHYAQPGHEESAGGHGEHAGHNGGGHEGHAEMFRVLFWRNLALAIPVLAFSEQIQDLSLIHI